MRLVKARREGVIQGIGLVQQRHIDDDMGVFSA